MIVFTKINSTSVTCSTENLTNSFKYKWGGRKIKVNIHKLRNLDQNTKIMNCEKGQDIDYTTHITILSGSIQRYISYISMENITKCCAITVIFISPHIIVYCSLKYLLWFKYCCYKSTSLKQEKKRGVWGFWKKLIPSEGDTFTRKTQQQRVQ